MIIGSIDNLKKYKAVDLTDCKTREDKIIKISNLKYIDVRYTIDI